MDKEYKEKAELIFSYTSMMLTEQGYIVPTFILIIDGQLRPIVIGNGEDITISKPEYKDIVYQAIKEHQPEAVIFICEQWIVAKSDYDPQTQSLVDNENKESYLTLTYAKPNGNSEALIAKIESDLVGTRYTKSQNWTEHFIPNMVQSWKLP